MHHPRDSIAHTTAFVTPVVEHWLEREIAQRVHPMNDRSDDPSHHERTLLPRSLDPACEWMFSFPGRANRARIVNAHLQDHNIYGMPWPAMSPDLSPIEHVMDMRGRRVRERQRPSTTSAELGHALQDQLDRFLQMDRSEM